MKIYAVTIVEADEEVFNTKITTKVFQSVSDANLFARQAYDKVMDNIRDDYDLIDPDDDEARAYNDRLKSLIIVEDDSNGYFEFTIMENQDFKSMVSCTVTVQDL